VVMGAESPVRLVPFSTRAVSVMSSFWLAGINILVKASGRVTEHPDPGAGSQLPKYFTATLPEAV